MTHLNKVLISVAISGLLMAPMVFAEGTTTQTTDNTATTTAEGRGGRGMRRTDSCDKMDKQGRRGQQGRRHGERRQERAAFKQQRNQSRPGVLEMSDKRIQRLEARLVEMKSNHQQFKEFYGSLNEEQKATLSSFRQERGRKEQGNQERGRRGRSNKRHGRQ